MSNNLIFCAYREWAIEVYEEIKVQYSNKFIHVDEGLNPHLSWRDNSPMDIIREGKSLYLVTHNHWWYEKIPFLS